MLVRESATGANTKETMIGVKRKSSCECVNALTEADRLLGEVFSSVIPSESAPSIMLSGGLCSTLFGERRTLRVRGQADAPQNYFAFG
jgi:hypothetical protein